MTYLEPITEHLRSFVIGFVGFASRSELAYDSFTVGLPGEVTAAFVGYNAHAVLLGSPPLAPAVQGLLGARIP